MINLNPDFHVKYNTREFETSYPPNNFLGQYPNLSGNQAESCNCYSCMVNGVDCRNPGVGSEPKILSSTSIRKDTDIKMLHEELELKNEGYWKLNIFVYLTYCPYLI